MRFWKKKEIVIPRSRQQIQSDREKIAEQVVNDLREQQIGLQPDYPVKPSKEVDESLLLSRLGVPPKKYYISSTAEVRAVTPRIKSTMPDEQSVIDDINSIKELSKKFYGDNE